MTGSNPVGAAGDLEASRTAPGRAGAAGSSPEPAVDPETGPVGSWGVRELVVRYGHHVALDGVDLEVPAGSVTAVVGADGAGKSSLLRALAGAVRPAAGDDKVVGGVVKPAQGRRLPQPARTDARGPSTPAQTARYLPS